MKSKNIKKFIKAYDEARNESLEKWGYFYPPKDFAEFEAWNEKIFEKHLNKEQKSPEIKTKVFVSLLDTTKDFGFLYAFEKQDFRLLNNVIFQTSRQNLLNRGMTASGTDHCNAFFDSLAAFACNDFEIIEAFFPKDFAPAKGQFYTENAVNLLQLLYYQKTDFQEEIIEKSQKFLTKKITLWEKWVVEYFLAILEKKSRKIKRNFARIMLSLPKNWLSDGKNRKMFCQRNSRVVSFCKSNRYKII